MNTSAAEAFYHRYIRSINERQGDLSEFVHAQVVYNGESLTRSQYEQKITESQRAAPDLYFSVTLVLAGEDRIAARIEFNCRPVSQFLGFEPTGKSVSFAEHVFYRLVDGRIAQVWSLIDLASVEKQINARD